MKNSYFINDNQNKPNVDYAKFVKIFLSTFLYEQRYDSNK